MKNFGRVLRLCLRYRLSVLGSVVCALAIGVLWGGNIGAIYPVVEVVFSGDSLQQSLDNHIDDAEQVAAEKQALAASWRRELDRAAPDERLSLEAKIAQAESRIKAERDAVARYRRIKPYVVRYLPDDPFLTLALFVSVLFLATLVKSLVLVAHQILVARLSQLGVFELRNLFLDRKSTRLNSSHIPLSRMPSSA